MEGSIKTQLKILLTFCWIASLELLDEVVDVSDVGVEVLLHLEDGLVPPGVARVGPLGEVDHDGPLGVNSKDFDLVTRWQIVQT